MPPRGRGPGRRAHRRGRRGDGRRCRWSSCIRFDYGSIVPWVRRREQAPARGRRARRALRSRRRSSSSAADLHTVADFDGRARASACRSCSRWYPSNDAAARRRSTPRRRSSDTEAFWREWVDALHVRRPLARRRHALAAHAQGAHLRADRRHRRRADDVAARAARRRPQLGLPLLLAARRDADARSRSCGRATTTRRARGATGCCARSPALRRSSRSCTASPASGGSTELELAWLAGLRGLAPGADRQRRRPTSSSSTSTARCSTRSTSARAGGHRRVDRRVGAQPAAARVPRGRLATSPTRASGRCAARAVTSSTRR